MKQRHSNCLDSKLCIALKRCIRRNGRSAQIWTGSFTNNPLSPERCEKYRRLWLSRAGLSKLPDELIPSMTRRAGNFTKAVTRHVTAGAKQIPQPEYDKRIAICNTCSLLTESRKCADKKCGCPIDKKAWWETETCPQSRWPRLPQFMPTNTTRHLWYHVYPLRHWKHGGRYWRWSASQLLQRIEQFNGQKIIAVATGPETESADAVREFFSEHGQRDRNEIHVVEVANDPGRRESLGLQVSLPLFSDKSKNSFTFFGHTKGATKDLEADPVIKWWAEWMYHKCLDEPENVNDQLSRYPCTGCFKKHGAFDFPKNHNWHYSGSFYWIRNADLFAREWWDVDHHPCGSESYPGRLFSWDESGCLWHEGGMEMNLYAPEYWEAHVIKNLPAWEQEKILPELERWKAQRQPA